MDTSEHSKRARVLFDEAHSEAWSIRADVAERMQSTHPADASLADAAQALERRDFEVAANADSPIDSAVLDGRRRARHRPSVRPALGVDDRRGRSAAQPTPRSTRSPPGSRRAAG